LPSITHWDDCRNQNQPTDSAEEAIGLVRYNTNGALDTSFGAGGIVSINPEDIALDVLFGIAVQSDGKILAAGPVNAGNDFLMIRLNPNGVWIPPLVTQESQPKRYAFPILER